MILYNSYYPGLPNIDFVVTEESSSKLFSTYLKSKNNLI